MLLPFLATLVALAVLAFWWMQRRGSAFRALVTELHQERIRFWRARLRAMDAPQDAAELQVRANRHLVRFRAIAEQLRSRHRESAAETWVLSADFGREEAAMAGALGSAQVDGEAALARIRHAEGEMRRPGASDGSGAPAGRVTLMGRPPLQVIGPSLLSLAVIAIFYTLWYAPPSESAKRKVLARLVAQSGCPRQIPPIGTDSVAGLDAAERCAVVWAAASALPPTPRARALLERGDTAGIHVLRMAELRASNRQHIIPGYSIRGRNIVAWNVIFAVRDTESAIHFVSVDQRTGRARVALSTR